MSKGGQSATNIYAYAQYLYGVPICATIDLDAPDKHLVQQYVPREEGGAGKGNDLVLNPDRSRWLLGNTVRIELVPGDKFWDTSAPALAPPENTFSLFAQTLRRRRRAEAGRWSEEEEEGPGHGREWRSPGPGAPESTDDEVGWGGGKRPPKGKAGRVARGLKGAGKGKLGKAAKGEKGGKAAKGGRG